jgi:hypothetical protein
VAKTSGEDRDPHGASVRIHDATHRALGRVAEWYRVSRRVLIDALLGDRLAAVSKRTSPQIDDAFRRDAPDKSLEAVLNKLFGLGLKEPAEGRGKGKEKLSATTMRVGGDTHRVVALLADWYGRDIPRVYDVLMLDRLHALHGRMADEFAGRKPKSDFRAAVKSVLGIDLPATLTGDEDTPAEKRAQTPEARGRRQRSPNMGSSQ